MEDEADRVKLKRADLLDAGHTPWCSYKQAFDDWGCSCEESPEKGDDKGERMDDSIIKLLRIGASNVDEWLPVIGFEGHYEVSSGGEVRSLIGPRGVLTSARSAPLVLKQQDRHGYRRIGLSKNGRRTHHFVHRLVLEAFAGPCLPSTEASHLNGVRSDNRAENLAWETKAKNAERRAAHGNNPHGENNPNSSITEPIAKSILLHLRCKALTTAMIARLHGTNKNVVQMISRGRTWRHLAETVKSDRCPER